MWACAKLPLCLDFANLFFFSLCEVKFRCPNRIGTHFIIHSFYFRSVSNVFVCYFVGGFTIHSTAVFFIQRISPNDGNDGVDDDEQKSGFYGRFCTFVCMRMCFCWCQFRTHKVIFGMKFAFCCQHHLQSLLPFWKQIIISLHLNVLFQTWSFFISLLLLFHILFRWRWLLLLVLVCSQCFCVQQINFFLRIYAVLMFRNNWNDVKSARTRSSSKGKKWITHLSISADWSARVFFSFPFCWCVGQHLMCCCGSLLACMRITIRSWMLLMFLKLKICEKWMIFITLLLAAFFLLLPQVFSGWLSYRILHQIGRMNCWRTQKNAHFYWLWVEKTVFFY